MNRKFFIFICLLFSALFANAQTTQKGRVLQYNGKLAKTPLNAVEIAVYNAGTTSSAADGSFKLDFRSLKVGDKVSYRRIEKLGYEIFNKEALDQWYISANVNPFLIVMCETSRFKEIRDNYERIASNSYARQQKAEEEKLNHDLKEGILTKKEYDNRINEIKEYYYDLFENMDNYIDQFSRIDLSSLSKQEQKIIDLIQNGKIDDAIKLYERLNFAKVYQKENNSYKKLLNSKLKIEENKDVLTRARDSIYASILRQVNTYRLAGGRENIDKAGKLLKAVADADTTNAIAVKNYCSFAYSQRSFTEALRYALIYNNLNLKEEERLSFMNNIGAIYSSLCQYDRAELYYKKSLDGFRMISQEDNDRYIFDIVRALSNLGNVNLYKKEYQKALVYYKEVLQLYSSPNMSDLDVVDDFATIQSNIGVLYMRMNENETAEKHLLEALDRRRDLFEKDSISYRADLASIQHNLGGVKEELQQLDSAIFYYENAKYNREILYGKNPDGFIVQLAMTLHNLAGLYNNINDLEAANNYANSAYDYYFKLYEEDQAIYKNDLASIEFLYGMICFKRKDYEKTELLMKSALSKYCNSEITLSTLEDACSAVGVLAVVCEEKNDIEQAESYYMQALEYANQLDSRDSTEYRSTLAANLYALALNQEAQNKNQEALGYMEKALACYSYLVESTESEEDFYYLSQGMNKAAILCYSLQLYDKAEIMYKNAIKCYQILYQDDKDMSNKVCAGVYVNLGILSYDQSKYEESVEYFSLANLALNGKYHSYECSALNSLAYKQASSGDYKNAIKSIDRAITLMPKNANYYDSKGEILLMQNKTKEALAIWNRLILLNPDFVDETKGQSELYKQLKAKGLIE